MSNYFEPEIEVFNKLMIVKAKSQFENAYLLQAFDSVRFIWKLAIDLFVVYFTII